MLGQCGTASENLEIDLETLSLIWIELDLFELDLGSLIWENLGIGSGK